MRIAPLRNFYERELKPFLEKPGARGAALGDAAQARSAFAQLRTLVPASLHRTVEDLEGICEEERQLTLQSHLHLWLHSWLLFAHSSFARIDSAGRHPCRDGA